MSKTNLDSSERIASELDLTRDEPVSRTPRQTMEYVDKTTGKPIVLDESKSEFLVLLDEDEGEALNEALTTGIFSVTRSTNDDRVLLLRLRSDGESENSIKNVVEKLQENPGISQVVPGAVDSAGETRFMLPNVVTVQVEDGKGAAVIKSLARLGSKVTRRFRSPDLFEVSVPDGQTVASFIAELNADSRVVFAEPSYYGFNDQELQLTVSASTTPPPPPTEGETVEFEWNVARVGAPAAWNVTRGKADIVLAIVDGMPEINHPALGGKFLLPGDDSNIFSAVSASSSHATSIAGIITGTGTINGIAPETNILPVVVNLNSQSYAERADAIKYVAEIARRKKIGRRTISRVVMSCSWRTRGDIAVVRMAIKEAVEAGVLAVFSAGNEQTETAHYPSDYADSPDNSLSGGVISVAATDRDDHRASYSNYSTKVSLCAPGGDGLPIDDRDILCADVGGVFTYAAGTSIAAPHVAAIAALLLSVDEELTPSDLKELLLNSATNIRSQNPMYQDTLGTGRVDAFSAVGRVGAGNNEPTPAPVEEPAPENGATSNSTPSLVTATTINVADINLIMTKLRATKVELQTQTGWSLAAVELQKGNQATAFDLLSEP